MQVYNDELYHYGKVGMKWGHRKTYGSMPRMLTTKRQLAADKIILDKMNNGDHHVSVGITKKRQEILDKRDKKILKDRIVKNTNKINKKKSVEEHRNTGIKAAGKALSIMGQMVARAHTNNQAMQLSKMIIPD